MLRDRAVDPVVNGVLTVFLSDEIVHARIGWAYLAHALKSADSQTLHDVADVVPAYVSGIAANLFGTDDAPSAVDVTHDDERLAVHGVCSMREEQTLYREFVRDVFIPGLLAVRVPLDRSKVLAALPEASVS
jgi:hypothetical protein